MRSLRLTAVLSVAAWLCLSGTTSRGVDAPPPPQTGTHQHNPFAGMDVLIISVLDEYKNLQPGEQQGIAVTLRDALEQGYPSHHFATVAYDYNEVNKVYKFLYPGQDPNNPNARSGAVTGPAGCDQAGEDPPWDACRGGGSLLRFFAGSRAVNAQGLPNIVRNAVVFWWPAEETIHVQVPGSLAQTNQALMSAWWGRLSNKKRDLWRGCAGLKTVPVDVTVMASCFAQAYAEYAATKHLTRARGFIVAPEQGVTYAFSSGHIFKYDTRIYPEIPGPLRASYDNYSGRIGIKLLFAALL